MAERPTKEQVEERIRLTLDGMNRWFRLESSERVGLFQRMQQDYRSGTRRAGEYFPIEIMAVTVSGHAAKGAEDTASTILGLIDRAYASAFSQVTEEQIQAAARAAATAWQKEVSNPVSGMSRFFAALYESVTLIPPSFDRQKFDAVWDIYPIQAQATAVYDAVMKETGSAKLAEMASAIGPDSKLKPGVLPPYYQPTNGADPKATYADVARIKTYGTMVETERAKQPSFAEREYERISNDPLRLAYYVVPGAIAHKLGVTNLIVRGTNAGVGTVYRKAGGEALERGVVRTVHALKGAVRNYTPVIGRAAREARLANALSSADPGAGFDRAQTRLKAFTDSASEVDRQMAQGLQDKLDRIKDPGFFRKAWRLGSVVGGVSLVWGLIDGAWNVAGAALDERVSPDEFGHIVDGNAARFGTQFFDFIPYAGTVAGVAAEDRAVMGCQSQVGQSAKRYCGISISKELGLTDSMIDRIEGTAYTFKQVKHLMDQGQISHPYIQAWLAESKRQFPDRGDDSKHLAAMREYLDKEMRNGRSRQDFVMMGAPVKTEWVGGLFSTTANPLISIKAGSLTNEQMRVDLINHGPIYMRLTREMMLKGMDVKQVSGRIREMFRAVQEAEAAGKGDELFLFSQGEHKGQGVAIPTNAEWSAYEQSYYAMERMQSVVVSVNNYYEAAKSFVAPGTEGISHATVLQMVQYNRHFREWFVQQQDETGRKFTEGDLLQMRMVAKGHHSMEENNRTRPRIPSEAIAYHKQTPVSKAYESIVSRYLKHIQGDGRQAYLEGTSTQLQEAAQAQKALLPFIENPGRAVELFALAYSLPPETVVKDPGFAKLVEQAKLLRQVSSELFKSDQTSIVTDVVPDIKLAQLLEHLTTVRTTLSDVKSTYVGKQAALERDEEVQAALEGLRLTAMAQLSHPSPVIGARHHGAQHKGRAALPGSVSGGINVARIEQVATVTRGDGEREQAKPVATQMFT